MLVFSSHYWCGNGHRGIKWLAQVTKLGCPVWALSASQGMLGSFPVPHCLFFVCLVQLSESILFCTCWAAQPPRPAILCSSCLHARWPPTRRKCCACLRLLRGTRICLCFVCNAHKTGLLIMPQGRRHRTSEIMNYRAPAKMSHTMAMKETYLSRTLLILFLPLPFLVSCDLSCQL